MYYRTSGTKTASGSLGSEPAAARSVKVTHCSWMSVCNLDNESELCSAETRQNGSHHWWAEWDLDNRGRRRAFCQICEMI